MLEQKKIGGGEGEEKGGGNFLLFLLEHFMSFKTFLLISLLKVRF